MSGKEAVVTTDANPRAPGPRAPAPNNQGRVGGPKVLLLCPELSLSERWTRASIRKYLRSEPLRLGVVIY